MTIVEVFPAGMKCEECSARFPVPVYHPGGRPCDKRIMPAVRAAVDGCFCQPFGPPYAGCPVHGGY